MMCSKLYSKSMLGRREGVARPEPSIGLVVLLDFLLSKLKRVI